MVFLGPWSMKTRAAAGSWETRRPGHASESATESRTHGQCCFRWEGSRCAFSALCLGLRAPPHRGRSQALNTEQRTEPEPDVLTNRGGEVTEGRRPADSHVGRNEDIRIYLHNLEVVMSELWWLKHRFSSLLPFFFAAFCLRTIS